MQLFLLASATLFVAAGERSGRDRSSAGAGAAGLTWMSLGATVLLMPTVASIGGYQPLDWAFLALLGAGCLALAHLRPAYRLLPWPAAGLTAVLLITWPLGSPGPAAGLFLLVVTLMGDYIWPAPMPRCGRALALPFGAP